jgi:hypothetical protein
MIRLWRKNPKAEEAQIRPPADAASILEAPAETVEESLPSPTAQGQRTSHRRVTGMRAAAVGLAGVGFLQGTRQAEAAYQTGAAGDGGDLVNTHLTVQGNVTVQGGQVIRVGTRVIADQNGCFYAQ